MYMYICLFWCVRRYVCMRASPGWGGGGGGGTRTRVTYFAEEGVFFNTSACLRFCKGSVLFLYPGTKYAEEGGGGGGENSLKLVSHRGRSEYDFTRSGQIPLRVKFAEKMYILKAINHTKRIEQVHNTN